MFDSLSYATFILAVVALMPALLYVLGKIKDPFNPLLLMGTLSYFVAGHRLIVNRDAHFDFLPAEDYVRFVWVAIFGVLGIYVGWWWGRTRGGVKQYTLSYWQSEIQVSKLVLAACFCTAVGVSVHFYIYDKDPSTLSGYLMDLQMLWIAAAILWIQIFFLSPNYRLLAGMMIIIAALPAIDRFLAYGQRGDTFRVAAIAELFYLIKAKRPSKAMFITAAIVLGLTLGTLQLTREIVDDGEATNRVTALVKVIPKFFQQHGRKADTGDEDIFGAASMSAVAATGHYGWGRSITIGMLAHCLPRSLFPNKDAWVTFHGGFDVEAIAGVTGLKISGGAAPSGFAFGFFELGWFSPIIWILIGYISRKLWDRATAGDLRYQGIAIGFAIAIVYGISQELLTAEINMIYVLVPLGLIYHSAHGRSESYLLPQAA